MKYRNFSDTGWRVSEIGLGCWQIGWCWGDISDAEARLIVKQALDSGVNFFDTSDTYGDGRSEKFLSEIASLHRNENIYITTKLGRRIRGTGYGRGFKVNAMEEFIDRSLSNLKTETIDLVQMHCPPLGDCVDDQTYEIMDRLVEKGKIRYYGISVYNLTEAFAALQRPNIKSIQLVFNIFRQRPRDSLFKLARDSKVAIIARGPLASGLLTGEIGLDTVFPENDHRNYNINGEAFDIGDTFSGIELQKGIEAVAELRKCLPSSFSLSQLALKWILSHPEVTTVIPGAVNSQQVIHNSVVSELEDISDLDARVTHIYETYIKADVHHRW